MMMIISNIVYNSFSNNSKSYLSNIVNHFWNVLTYSISAIDNPLDSLTEKYLFDINFPNSLARRKV